MVTQSAAVGLPVADTTNIVKGSTDGTKLMRFEVDGLTTGTTRVMTVPDKDMTLCGTDDAMLLSGANAMAGDLDMGDYDIYGINTLKAHDASAISCEDSNGNKKVSIATADYAFFAYADMYLNHYQLKAVRTIILSDASELTIASGVVTATQSYHTIDTEGNAATDDLSTINGGTAGQVLTIRANHTDRTVVVKDGLSNLQLEGDMSLDNAQDTISMIYDGTNWLETGRSNNGA